MFLTITDAAQQKLAKYLTTDKKIILDLDDGVGEYSKVGSCALNLSYRLLVVDQDTDISADYSGILDSTVGSLHIKPYSTQYLDQDMRMDVNPRLNTLGLFSESEQMDPNVNIVDIAKEIKA
ncbi:iron-sulfur cluster biosynthesis family protein [Loigolactobacillus zhaoyuanensis]|uniref:iron-sulfur cluster biosynthesis family protein n=1 Tax=Loigolactobacillus zhaoyuanensis TaxID=2486017 RepID=UPI000F737DF3|nr:iron-sulfur cluster biosynthesis family protein [Loigolactobacillus zhaoyuanensis]